MAIHQEWHGNSSIPASKGKVVAFNNKGTHSNIAASSSKRRGRPPGSSNKQTSGDASSSSALIRKRAATTSMGDEIMGKKAKAMDIDVDGSFEATLAVLAEAGNIKPR